MVKYSDKSNLREKGFTRLTVWQGGPSSSRFLEKLVKLIVCEQGLRRKGRCLGTRKHHRLVM